MKTLVIGGAGFLGSHLLPVLLDAAQEVTVQDVIPSEAATKLKPVIKDIRYLWKSVLDITSDDIRGYDHIISLAAQGDVPLAISSPKWTYTLNLDSTLALLESVRQYAAQNRGAPLKVVYMSSDNVYGQVPPERLPVVEDEPMRPANAYGASKAAAELFINAYIRQWNLPIVILRGTSMYGEGARLKQVIPIFIQQALKNEAITIEGDGSQTRDFNYVKNTATAILMAIQAEVTHGTWNIGSGKEASIKELAQLIVKLTGSKSEIVHEPWRHGEEGLRLFLSIERAKRDLGYSPAYSQEEGLERTIQWFRGLE